MKRIAIAGAGMSGLSCARRLTDAGHAVTVFEKGRGLGGRCATRRDEGVAFDHGAQFATAESADFQEYLRRADAAGCTGRWDLLEALRGDGRTRHVGVPGMSSIVAPLALGLDVQRSTEVKGAVRERGGWIVDLGGGDRAGPFDALVLAVPAPQAGVLAGPHPFAARLAEVSYAPCWAGLVAFAEPLDAPDIIETSIGAIAWAARNGTKPGRDAGNDCWVLHASVEWSRAALEERSEDIAPALENTFTELAGALPPAVHITAHRWRHALVERPLGDSHLWDGDLGLGLCGDWCLGPRVEAAFISGRMLAAAIAG